MTDSDPARWLGLVSAIGVLLALVAWYVLPRASAQLRRIVLVLTATLFLVAAAGTVGHVGTIGSRLFFPGSVFGSSDGRRWFDVVLALIGLGLGLAFSTGAWPGVTPGVPGVEAEDDAADDDAPLPTAQLTLPPWATPPVRTLLAVTVALGAPAAGFVGVLIGGLYVPHPNGWTVTAVLLYGVLVGAALLFAVLLTDGIEPRLVLLAFGVTAAGAGLETAWPQTFGEEFWWMFTAGLAVGLLVPVALRLLRTPFETDRMSVVWGVVAAALLTAIAAGAATKSSSNGIGGFLDTDDVNVRVPVVPTFDVPTFEVPTFDVPTFEVPTP